MTELPLVGVCATSVLLASFIIWRAGTRWQAFWGLKHPWRYPPIWCAATLGTAFLLPAVTHIVIIPPDPAESVRTLSCTAIAIASASALVLALAWALRNLSATFDSRAAPDTVAEASFNLSGYQDIVEWIRDDRAVSEPGRDRFGLAPVAKRTAERLVRNAGSQLVVGALGSGKSSLLNLTRWYLQRMSGSERVRIVEVELWQYETARAAVSGIIRALAHALGDQINTVSITGVRSQYLDAMSETGGAGAVLAKVLHHDADPYNALEAISRSASAIGLHFVVWIEDVERFLDGGGGSSSQGLSLDAGREAELLNPVRALVHGLDRLDHVSVVTATTSLVGRFDVEKLARFVEDVPRLRVDQVAEVLTKFRRGLTEDHPEDIFPVQRTALDSLENPYWFFRGPNPRNRDVAETLVHLFDTPRKLKQALRLAHDVWAKLHGEIDRDDLLLMAGLRVSSPQGFSLIRDHYAELQRLRLPEDRRGEQDFGRALDAIGLSRERQDVWAVAESVFARPGSEPRPQGLHVTRYWERFLAEEAPDAGDLDQDVLRAIRDEDALFLLDRLVSGQGPMVENFDHLLPDGVVFRLLIPLCERLRTVKPSSWASESEFFGGNAPGVVNLWRIWLGKLRSAPLETLEGLLQMVAGELQIALPSSVENLGLLRDLEYYYLSSGKEQPLVLFISDSAQGYRLAAQIREAMWAALVEHFIGKPEGLANAVHEAKPFSLFRVVWGSERCENKVFDEVPFARWPELAPTILDGARSNLDLLSELAPFVVREAGTRLRNDRGYSVYEYDRELCIRLFVDEEKVLALPWYTLPEKTRTGGCVDAVRKVAFEFAWERRMAEGCE